MSNKRSKADRQAALRRAGERQEAARRQRELKERRRRAFGWTIIVLGVFALVIALAFAFLR